jgi:hypothetical protein
VVPTDDIVEDDLRQAILDLVGTGEVPAVLDDPLVDHADARGDLLDQLVTASERRPIVLLTDDPDTLGWAISLPDDIGAVTRLAAHTDPAQHPPVPQRSDPISSPTGPVA